MLAGTSNESKNNIFEIRKNISFLLFLTFYSDPAAACCVAYSQKAQKKNSGRFLKFLKMIEIPWLMQDNDLPFSDIAELSDYGISYQLKVHDRY